jgi:murein tripeptide amidase MpaA
MSYFNYDEILSAIQVLSATSPDLAELVSLPHLTHESRTVSALLIGRARAIQKPTFVLVGGVHAREWIPPDALICLAADLVEAGETGTGLIYGGAEFSAPAISRLLDAIQIAILPCANPDGRVYSQHIDPDWRKNRRPTALPGGGLCHGVDINRNFDVAWDFKLHFAPGTVSASADPCHKYLYIGPAACSEPETRNIVWLLDTFADARWFVDIHSAVPAVFHTWGLDSNQTFDPSQNFRNPAYHGMRGNLDDAYGEFIRQDDLDAVQELAATMREAIRLVDGDNYAIGPAFELYATSGASDDYAYSRHLARPGSQKVLGFTMECGRDFQPPEPVRETVIKEVSAALVAFAVKASVELVK